MVIGKTTFLNALSGKAKLYGTVKGQILINNNPKLSIESLQAEIGFVPQEDTCHEDLTVYENLYYAAMLKLPSKFTLERKLQIIDSVLEMLGITAIRNSVVGSVEKRGISGGQKKRLSIGMELVSHPKLIFLDEVNFINIFRRYILLNVF